MNVTVHEFASLAEEKLPNPRSAFRNVRGTWSVVKHDKDKLTDEFPTSKDYVEFLNSHGILDWRWDIDGNGSVGYPVPPTQI